MNSRPRSITIISWVFILLGSATALAGLPLSFDRAASKPLEDAAIFLLRVVPIVCGISMLQGRNWARWLLLPWLAFHVVLGALHSVPALIVHILLFVVPLNFLFLAPSSKFFLTRSPSDK
jgi:hypothetical protein